MPEDAREMLLSPIGVERRFDKFGGNVLSEYPSRISESLSSQSGDGLGVSSAQSNGQKVKDEIC